MQLHVDFFNDTYILITLIVLYVDETGLDALQTLADLSLMMPDSAVESGECLMLSF